MKAYQVREFNFVCLSKIDVVKKVIAIGLNTVTCEYTNREAVNYEIIDCKSGNIIVSFFDSNCIEIGSILITETDLI